MKNQNEGTENIVSSSNQLYVPTLKYYPIRGLGHPIRNILHHFNINFHDKQILMGEQHTKIEQSLVENSFDTSLPMFEDQHVKISNCIAIGIYLWNKYGDQHKIKLKAKTNQIMFKYSLQMSKIMPNIMHIVAKACQIEGSSQQIFIIESLKKLVNESKFINYCLKQHRKTGSFILQKITIIDFYFYETCFYVDGFFGSLINQSQQLNAFGSFARVFEGLNIEPKNKGKIKIFFPFKNQKMHKAIIEMWEGQKRLLFV